MSCALECVNFLPFSWTISCDYCDQNPKELHDYLPPFVKDAHRIREISVFRYANSDEVKIVIDFLTSSDRAKNDFDVMRNMANLSHHSQENKGVHCDGPCGRDVSACEIVQFGLCDHNICLMCVKGVDVKKKLYDGSPCCCNIDCLSRRGAKSNKKKVNEISRTKTNVNLHSTDTSTKSTSDWSSSAKTTENSPKITDKESEMTNESCTSLKEWSLKKKEKDIRSVLSIWLSLDTKNQY